MGQSQRAQIKAALSRGILSAEAIAALTEIPKTTVEVRLSEEKKKGTVVQPSLGLWGLATHPDT